MRASSRAAFVLVAAAIAVSTTGLDGRRLEAKPLSSTFARLDAFRRGDGTIDIHSSVMLPRLSVGRHRLSFRNDYRRHLSVYLANALVPESDWIAVVAQRRDTEQRHLAIDYGVREPTWFSRTWMLHGVALAAVLAALVKTRRLGQN